jgi:methionyl-tRNA formyltransferase
MGSPEFSVPTLRALDSMFQVTGVATQRDKPRGRGRKTVPTPVKLTAIELGLPVAEPNDISSDESMALLKTWDPDVIVVAAYGKILPEKVLSLPRMGCVNLHASVLPRHRGASPVSAAILAGDKMTGVCTIMMDRGMDTGDILLKREVPIQEDDTAGSLHDKLMELGAEMVVETLRRMAAHDIRPEPQNHEDATYTRPLSKEDGRIVWNEKAQYLSRLVRAMNPWPSAFTYLGDEPVKIWKAVAREGNGAAGLITAISPEGICVGTGGGLLLLTEVQAPGKKRLAASDFARGRRMRKGDRFHDAA